MNLKELNNQDDITRTICKRGLGGCHPSVLIIDAPRQHEISLEDFANYFGAVEKELAMEPSGLQVIISLSDQVFPQNVPHKTIIPKLADGDQEKLFGVVK